MVVLLALLVESSATRTHNAGLCHSARFLASTKKKAVFVKVMLFEETDIFRNNFTLRFQP